MEAEIASFVYSRFCTPISTPIEMFRLGKNTTPFGTPYNFGTPQFWVKTGQKPAKNVDFWLFLRGVFRKEYEFKSRQPHVLYRADLTRSARFLCEKRTKIPIPPRKKEYFVVFCTP